MYFWSAKNPLYLQRGYKQKSGLGARGRGSQRGYWMTCGRPGFLASFGHALKGWERETTCWREKRKGMGEEQNHTTVKKPGPIHRNHAFNTLWSSYSCALKISTVDGDLDHKLFLKIPEKNLYCKCATFSFFLKVVLKLFFVEIKIFLAIFLSKGVQFAIL